MYIFHFTCNHDNLVQVTQDIDLKRSLDSRDGSRRVFSWSVKRQRKETFFGAKENQLKEKRTWRKSK